ncbi:exonuclease domain-containing protein [Streptacidiphilus sp. MAP5-52]|uniref:3'-5' exonuclease n=1 Tax=Streptacidiphilus sp. MAP5-52 TaxID=3156267 RepID=UPI00351867D5
MNPDLATPPTARGGSTRGERFGWPARLLVLDTEGNGQQPPDLVELAAIPLIDGLVTPARGKSVIIRPPRPVTQRAAALHGLTNQILAAAPTWDTVKQAVRADLTGAWICAHNAHVDHTVLARHLPGWQPAGVIDTLRLARRLLPGAPSYRLDALITQLGIDTTAIAGRRHRAWFDAHAAALLLHTLAERTPSWSALAAIAQQPVTSPSTRRREEATLW